MILWFKDIFSNCLQAILLTQGPRYCPSGVTLGWGHFPCCTSLETHDCSVDKYTGPALHPAAGNSQRPSQLQRKSWIWSSSPTNSYPSVDNDLKNHQKQAFYNQSWGCLGYSTWDSMSENPKLVQKNLVWLWLILNPNGILKGFKNTFHIPQSSFPLRCVIISSNVWNLDRSASWRFRAKICMLRHEFKEIQPKLYYIWL